MYLNNVLDLARPGETSSNMTLFSDLSPYHVQQINSMLIHHPPNPMFPAQSFYAPNGKSLQNPPTTQSNKPNNIHWKSFTSESYGMTSVSKVLYE